MTEQEARELAALIRTQFPFHWITVVEATDKRNAPRNWIIGVMRSFDSKESIIIHSRQEWDECLLTLSILED